MITWMQRHKKYLVVTIWISVIAFVGAGFVGWGAYDMNADRASSVAKVGDRQITVQQFQLAYANQYNFYNNMMGGKLTQEKADELGLDTLVLKSLMDEALILSYADELGIVALDSEVKTKLANDDAFKEKGVFNKEIYYSTLKRTGLSANEYEKSLKKQILLEKVQMALQTVPTKQEKDTFKSAILMQDRLEVATISADSASVVVDDKEAEQYWESHKKNYMTTKSYDIELIDIPLVESEVSEEELKAYYEERKHKYTDSEGKILDYASAKDSVKKDLLLKMTKKEALKIYLAYKKGETKATTNRTILDNDISFPVDKIKEVKEGEFIKPIENSDGYIVAKLTKITPPQPKSYEAAKNEVVNLLSVTKQAEELDKAAKAQLSNFKGKDIGFVARDSITKILGLDEAASADLINYVFDNKEKEGYKIVGNKAILYRVLEQKLLLNNQAEKYNDLISQNLIQVKQAEINQNILKRLAGRYESEQYYKGK